MDKLTAIFKALSDRNRLRIVLALMTCDELCACQLTELIQVTGATASRHMGVLISSGLVSSRKDGRWVYYRLCREQTDFRVLIDWVASQLSNDQDALSDVTMLTDITAYKLEDLCRKQRGEACCPKKED
jgi:ArsR family transcriptional regulator